ncbi:MFS transporter [Cellulomonas sp. 179-A 4D5 NHS]|uniref:MFS transporter n=1 Tax=Cellulomonas sp. 179-A 4D5 NHS TaxID=3142378 RepID=UPI0039A1DF8A
MTVVAPVRALPLPRPYLVWLSGFALARLGDTVLAFALGWAAAGLGGTTAALVVTVGAAPRLLLLVVGGAVADRSGARRLLIAGEVTLLALTLALAPALARFGTPGWLLVGASLALGTVTAVCLPASGSMPRRLVPDDQLARALAVRQGVGQVVLMTAAPMGGLLVGTVGLPAVAWGAAATLGVSVGVLVAVQESPGSGSDDARSGAAQAGAARARVDGAGGAAPAGGTSPDAPASGSPAAGRSRTQGLDLVGGVRVVGRTPGLRGALLLLGAGAALLLPVPSVLVPLLGRAHGWGPGATGGVAGALGLGVIGAALLAARRRAPGAAAQAGTAGAAGPTHHRSGSPAPGLAVSAGGALVLAVGPALGGPAAVVVAAGGALVLGFGNGTFVARLAPVVLGSAPRTHLSRVQALAGLVQLAPVLVTTAVLGALAERTSAGWALASTAAGLAACAVGAWRRAARAAPAPVPA